MHGNMTKCLPPLATVLSFIDCINRLDLDGLGRLMGESHRLVVFDERPLVGREANVNAWRGYMTRFPNYVIYPERLSADGARVAVLGTTSGSHLGLPDEEEQKLRLIWIAFVTGDKVDSWELVADTEQKRAELGLA